MAKAGAIFDGSELEDVLLKYGARARSFDHRLITFLLLEHVEAVADSQGSKGADGRWARFARTTLIRHPERRGGKLLHATGRLTNFQSSTSGEVSKVWSPANYADFFRRGTRNMPKRDPFAIRMEKFLRESEKLIVTEIAG